MWRLWFFCLNENRTIFIEVKVDLDQLDTTTAETKATYPEIKEYVLQKYGLKAHTAYIAHVRRIWKRLFMTH
jgi:hypothetical protein